MPSDWANNEARKLAELLDDPETMRLSIAQMLDLSLACGLLSAAKITQEAADNVVDKTSHMWEALDRMASTHRAKAKEIQDAI